MSKFLKLWRKLFLTPGPIQYIEISNRLYADPEMDAISRNNMLWWTYYHAEMGGFYRAVWMCIVINLIVSLAMWSLAR